MKIYRRPPNLLALIRGILFFSNHFVIINALNKCSSKKSSDKYCIKDSAIYKINDDGTVGERLYNSNKENYAYFFDKYGNIINDTTKDISEGYICTSIACNLISSGGTYINSENTKYIAIYANNKLSKCTEGNGIYLSGIRNDLKNAIIQCESSGCSLLNACTKAEYEYFVDADKYSGNYGYDNETKPLIFCKLDINIISCESNVRGSPDIYYINAGESTKYNIINNYF